MLYQAELAGLGATETVAAQWQRQPEPDETTRAFAERLVGHVLADRALIDGMVASASHHWAVDRMGVVDRNILRLAAAELLREPGTPPAVVIDEAVEMAKQFGETESSAFVNGVLEAIRARLAKSAVGARSEGP
jgi:N utilization substance protein B